MNGLRRWLAAGTIVALNVAGVTHAGTLQIHGTIRDEGGAAVPFVRVNISGAKAVPLTTSVFSTEDGSFTASLSDADADKLHLESFRIGWEEAAREQRVTADGVDVALTLKRKENVADQVPASAWIPGTPGDRDFHILINECAGCHQLGAARVKRFASGLDGQPLVTRRAAWDAVVQFMRAQALHMGPAGHTHLRWGLTEDSEDYKMAIAPATSFFLPRDMDIVIPYLAEHYPTNFESYSGYDDVQRLGRIRRQRAYRHRRISIADLRLDPRSQHRSGLALRVVPGTRRRSPRCPERERRQRAVVPRAGQGTAGTAYPECGRRRQSVGGARGKLLDRALQHENP